MKNADICPHWNGAGVERYYGISRRDTRRVRTKIYNFCKTHGTFSQPDKPREYLPFGLCNSWIANGLTVTPMWVRPVPKNSPAPWFVLLVHEGTRLLGWYECYEYDNFWQTRTRFVIQGESFFGQWHDRGLNYHLHCVNFYRPYEEPTKDLGDFDDWRAENCPQKVAWQIVRDYKPEWDGYVGGVGRARYAYEAGERLYNMEILRSKARREENARSIAYHNHTSEYNKRQLRALGFVA